MATSLTLATGALSATVTTNNDTAAQVLLRYAHAAGADPAWTPQQKLNFAASALADYMLRVARDRYILEESATVQANAVNNVHW